MTTIELLTEIEEAGLKTTTAQKLISIFTEFIDDELPRDADPNSVIPFLNRFGTYRALLETALDALQTANDEMNATVSKKAKELRESAT